jgi:hypothetical protein
MTDKNTTFKDNISRAVSGGFDYDISNQSIKDLENISFSNPLYEASMLKHTTDDGYLQTYFRFRGYSRLSEKQKCIEEVIRQAEIYHEDQIGIKVIKWIQEQNSSIRFRYLSSSGLLFGMKFSNLELYDFNKVKHNDILYNFFHAANEANVPPLDIIRYHRLLTSNDKNKNELFNHTILVDNNQNIQLSKFSNCDKIEPYVMKEESFIESTINSPISINKIPLYNLKGEPIYIENEYNQTEQLSIDYYSNDTIETIKLRYAVENNIPIEMVKMDFSDEIIVEEKSSINDVDIYYVSSQKWRYNMLEHKKILMTSIIDIIEQNPIDIKSNSSINTSISKLSEIIESDLNINKLDGYYIYLLIRTVIFDGYPFYDPNTLQCVNPDEIINFIDDNVSYIDILIAKPIEQIKFRVVIENYCKSFIETIKLGKQYVNNIDENGNISSTLNTFHTLQIINKMATHKSQLIKSDILETSFTMNGEFKLQTLDLYELFNMLEINNTVPFANLGQFYKCLNGIKVPNDWTKEEENTDVLRFYINQLEVSTLKDENYSLCSIRQIRNENDINVYEYNIYGTINIDIQLLLQKFIKVLPSKPINMTVKKQFGKGMFIYSDILFNEDIFYDFATNNPIFSQMINIDEKYKIHKIRGGLKFTIQYNKLNGQYPLKCVIKIKTIEKSTEQEVKDFPKIAQVGKEIMTVQCSGSLNIHILHFYKHMFEQLLYYMQHSYHTYYMNYYCKYISNIQDIVKPVVTKKIIQKDLTLKDIAADLFLPGYVRSCSYPPNIITDEEKDKYNKEGKQVMTFPNKKSGLTIHNYVCNKDKKKIYPGLRMNDLENSEIYPVVPCCYQDDQNVEGTIRYNYEHNLPLTDDSISSTFITTRKLLKIGQEGALPIAIKNILTMTDNDTLLGNAIFIRTYVPRSNWSIVDTLRLATSSKLTDQQFIEKCNSFIHMNLLSQSNISIEEALHILQTKSYIEVRDWCIILELIFQVKIFIFATTKDNYEGFLSHEHYKRYYIINPTLYQNFKHSVFILNTFGGEFDRIEYPHNECIIKKGGSTNKKKDIQFLFPIQGETSSSIFSIWKIITNNKNVSSNLPFTEQYEDGYGKIRKCKLDDIEVYTNPIAPSILKSSTSTVSTKKYMDGEKALHLLEKYKFTNIRSLYHKNNIIALVASNNKELELVIKVSTKHNSSLYQLEHYDLSINGHPITPSDQISFLKQYNYFNRLTNVIISYACFYYSTLKFTNNINLTQFTNYITIKENHNYGTLSRLININNTNIIQNNKLIVTNSTIKIKILHYLSMLETYNEQLLLTYRFNKYIPYYYNNAEDFTKSIHSTIYNNLEEYLETRRLKKPQYALYNLFFKNNISYFYSNIELKNGKVFLVIPTTSEKNAAVISIHFKYTQQIIQHPPLYSNEEEYDIITQDNNKLIINENMDENTSECLILHLIVYKSKREEYWYSLIPFN